MQGDDLEVGRSAESLDLENAELKKSISSTPASTMTQRESLALWKEKLEMLKAERARMKPLKDQIKQATVALDKATRKY